MMASRSALVQNALSLRGEGSEDEGGDASRIVTRKVKVKRGKRLVNVEMTGPQSTYDSAEWHQANDLFVFDAPLTSTGSNKIVTHVYPYDEKHPCFSKTWKHQVTLASLPMRSFFTRGKVSSLFCCFIYCFADWGCLSSRVAFGVRSQSPTVFACTTGTTRRQGRACTAARITSPARRLPSSLIGR
jgi:hypothetical protein